MTNAQKTIKEINRLLSEFADGYVFVGFNPKDGQSMMAVHAEDSKTEMALNAYLSGILQSGGVGAVRDEIKRKEKENEEEED